MTEAALKKLAEEASPTMRANIAAALSPPPPRLPAALATTPPGKAEAQAKAAKPQIRMPREDRNQPNKTEQRFRDHYERLWKPAIMLYEPVSLRLPSGTLWTPDWLMEWPDGLRLHVETKGAHIHNSRSVQAYKEAVSAFNFEKWKFLFAQWKGGQWLLSGYQRTP